MPTSFNCPMCAAPLDFSSGNAVTMRCPYCGNTIIIPEEARGVARNESTGEMITGAFAPMIDQALKVAEVARLLRAGNKIAAIKLYRETFGVGLKEAKDAVEKMETGQPISFTHTEVQNENISSPFVKPIPLMQEQARRQKKRGAGFWLAVGIILLIAVIGLFIILGAVAWSLTSRPTPPTEPTSRPARSSTSGFASVALEFGSEGIGAGQFKDARSIAFDGQGRIYVGEYTGGRVQVFDPQGTFITQWMVDPKRALLNLAADRKGVVYVVHPNMILRYQGRSGTLLGEVSTSGSNRSAFYSDLFVALDGTLYTISSNSNIIRLGPDGEVKSTIKVADKVGEDVDFEKVAVDGNGYIYALAAQDHYVYKFAPDGRFLNKFGGKGREAGQLDSPSHLAIDGQGRIYISDLGRGIQVFDNNGRYLDSCGSNTVIFGMAINDRNEIFASDRNHHKIIKFVLNKR